MTGRRSKSSLYAVLAGLLWIPLLASASDDDYFSEAGYRISYDEPRAANQVNLQPVGLTAGLPFLDEVDVEDLLLRCAVFTGVSGINVSLEGSLSEGDDLNPVGEFPEQRRNTRNNGYAVFQGTVADIVPPPDVASVDAPLLAAIAARLNGTREIEGAAINCSLGVPATCAADDVTACLQGERFRVNVFWEDPIDGTTREATVESSDRESALFNFFPLDDTASLLVSVLDRCGLGLSESAFWFESGGISGVDVTLVVTDTVAGITRQFSDRATTDISAFQTCP